MNSPRKLSRAPIVEALLDIRVALAGSVSLERLEAAAAETVTDFPQREHIHAAHAQLRVEPGRQFETVEFSQEIRGLLVTSADRLSAAQFRVDGFTLNRLRPYTSWEGLLPQALRLWNAYKAALGEFTIARLGVRYINRIPLALTSDDDIDDFILTSPKLPIGVPDIFTSFRSQTTLFEPAKRLSAVVNQRVEIGSEPESKAWILDIDAYSIDAVSSDTSDVEDRLNALRSYKNQIFFGSLTDRLIRNLE
jgi:uncharacterized protein (TIGR04255 family)